MPSFRGIRVTRTSGYGAGRGDNPHPSMASMPPSPGSPGGPPPPPPLPPRPVGMSDSRVARKANSPKRMAKALKNVNKNPLGVHEDEYSTAFSSDYGFKESDAATAYNIALHAESSLKNNKYDSIPRPPGSNWTPEMLREHDQDTVGSYLATGKGRYTDEAQSWIDKKGSGARKRRDAEYG